MFFKENQMSSEHRIKSDPLATEGWKRAGWTSEEKYKAYHNQYYQKRKSEISKERRSNIPQRWIDRTKRRAKERGLEWNLSKSFLRTLIVPICPILGIELCYTNLVLADNSPTIDRIDNTLGYIEGNIQVLSCLANRMKSNATPEQLLKFAEYVVKKYGDSGDLSPPRPL
jgi:hypothetical protein